MTYEIREFTPQRLLNVRSQWEQIAGPDEFAVELAVTFDWAESHLSPATGSSQALELLDIESQDTHAILELIDGKRGQLTKLLTMYASPIFWNVRPDDTNDVVRLYSGAIKGVVPNEMADDEDSKVNEVRIYGREPQLLTVIQTVQQFWLHDSDWQATMEGRWLVLRKASRKGTR